MKITNSRKGYFIHIKFTRLSWPFILWIVILRSRKKLRWNHQGLHLHCKFNKNSVSLWITYSNLLFYLLLWYCTSTSYENASRNNPQNFLLCDLSMSPLIWCRETNSSVYRRRVSVLFYRIKGGFLIRNFKGHWKGWAHRKIRLIEGN